MKSLSRVATPEQLKEVRELARLHDIAIYYDTPYNHFKGYGWLRDWNKFVVAAVLILPMDSWQEYAAHIVYVKTTIPALRVRVK